MVEHKADWMIQGPRALTGFALAMIAGSVLLSASGCSTTATKARPQPSVPKNTEAAPEPEPKSPPIQCAIAQRDLTLPWGQRRYWCRPEGAPIADAALPAIRHVAPTVACGPKPQPAPSQPEPPQASVRPVHQAPAIAGQYIIRFAPTAVALGPAGRRQAEALLPAARTHCRHNKASHCVFLQGSTLGPERERNPLIADPDELAVGRALAVRAVLEAGGIERERIKIFHRDPAQVTRQVEVRFDG